MNFAEIIIRLLTKYKRLLRRHLTPTVRNQKIQTLGLQRGQLKQYNNISLYQAAQKVIFDLEQWLDQKASQSTSWFSGLDEFLQHLKSVLHNYRLIDNKVLHAPQLASHAMIEAIQLLATEYPSASDQQSDRLLHCAINIAHYGNQEQQTLFVNALRKRAQQNKLLYTPIIKTYEQRLQEIETI